MSDLKRVNTIGYGRCVFAAQYVTILRATRALPSEGKIARSCRHLSAQPRREQGRHRCQSLAGRGVRRKPQSRLFVRQPLDSNARLREELRRIAVPSLRRARAIAEVHHKVGDRAVSIERHGGPGLVTGHVYRDFCDCAPQMRRKRAPPVTYSLSASNDAKDLRLACRLIANPLSCSSMSATCRNGGEKNPRRLAVRERKD